jgi:hypothetical protein
MLGLASAVILRSKSSGTHDHILLPQIQHSPNLEGQVSVFISPQEQCGSVIPPWHWVKLSSAGLVSSLYSLGSDPTENTAFNSSPIVVGVFTNPLPINGSLLIRPLQRNGCTRYNIIRLLKYKSMKYLTCSTDG